MTDRVRMGDTIKVTKPLPTSDPRADDPAEAREGEHGVVQLIVNRHGGTRVYFVNQYERLASADDWRVEKAAETGER